MLQSIISVLTSYGEFSNICLKKNPKRHIEAGSLTNTLNISMFEVLMFHCFNELVGDMVVDPDAVHTKGEHTQTVLVIIGQRAMADCVKKGKSRSNDIL